MSTFTLDRPERSVALQYDGVKLIALRDQTFGTKPWGRWKYMGERRRWAKLIPLAPMAERPVPHGHVGCSGCGGVRTVKRQRKGKEYTRLCRKCGLSRSIQIFRVRGPRERQWDHANLTAACRAVIDSLVERLWLVDDGPMYMTATYDDSMKAPTPAVVIVLHEVQGRFQ